MNISNSQVNRLRHFVRAGLRSLFRPEPQTAVEWADANYYLPKESAYQEGRWETLPFQRAIMNAMGSDYIREVNVVKSARVGYSKMLLGVYAYFIEHKQRNTLIWLPTDGDAENFMKTHVEPTIRDIPSLLALAPWYGKKHRDNTLTMKRFTNGRGFWCLGGKAAKNYREKSVDVAGYDELAAFDEDIEQEGSPTFLGDKGGVMDITPFLHALCAVAAQVLVGLFTGNWAYGAIAGCTFFIAREHTQAEYRWIEMFGHGKRMNMPWWGGFDTRAWDVASLMDFAVPVVACLLVWLLVNRG
ncbi:hypothetical protein ESCOMM011M_23835 [Escherichia coli]